MSVVLSNWTGELPRVVVPLCDMGWGEGDTVEAVRRCAGPVQSDPPGLNL
jgi:hypothetical protein